VLLPGDEDGHVNREQPEADQHTRVLLYDRLLGVWSICVRSTDWSGKYQHETHVLSLRFEVALITVRKQS